LRTGDRAVVYVRLPEETTPVFEGREIVLGPAVGSEFIVREGLEEGELVVTRGAFKLDSELQIKGKPSMMNPMAGIEERPANSAPEALAGQWTPVLRALFRLQEVARKGGAAAAMTAELETMESLVRQVRTDSLQAEELILWKEFSNRLLGGLILASDRIETQPAVAVGMVSRDVRQAGRYLGLRWDPIETPEANQQLAEALRQAVDAYLPVGKALADDNDAAAAEASAAFLRVLGPLDLPAAKPLRETAAALKEAADIKTRRAAFRDVSVQLIKLVRAHGIDQVGDLYVVHCPMAFKVGADWLSASPEVLNPYYGDAMLHCGDVTDTPSVERKTPPQAAPGGISPQEAQETQKDE